jgi:nuclear pore complex protein Nup155
VIIGLLEKYAFEHCREVGTTWVMDLLIDINVPYQTITGVLEAMFYNNEVPFDGANRRVLAKDLLYVLGKWYQDGVRTNQRLFGGDETAASVVQTLGMLCQNGLGREEVERAQELRRQIERSFR